MEAGNGGRHCALCLDPLTDPLCCGQCHKRAYCTKECQKKNWKAGGSGQGHKTWCAVGAGEEGVDWKVRHISEQKGLGLVALRTLPEGFRIMVGTTPTVAADCHAGTHCLGEIRHS